jgi:hypothetical protein
MVLVADFAVVAAVGEGGEEEGGIGSLGVREADAGSPEG